MLVTVRRDFWYQLFRGLYWLADKTHSNLLGKWALLAAKRFSKVVIIPLSCDKVVR